MQIKVKIPKLGLTIESGKLTGWSKAVGDRVRAGEPIGVIEADKAVYDLEAPVAGRIAQLVVPADADAEYAVGTLVAVIDTE